MVTVQITEQLLRQTYPEHCQTFKMVCFAKRTMPECKCSTRIFSMQGGEGRGGEGRGEIVELGHLDKHFVNNIRKRGLTGKHFGNFCPRHS